jgi:hypothetical protein
LTTSSRGRPTRPRPMSITSSRRSSRGSLRRKAFASCPSRARPHRSRSSLPHARRMATNRRVRRGGRATGLEPHGGSEVDPHRDPPGSVEAGQRVLHVEGAGRPALRKPMEGRARPRRAGCARRQLGGRQSSPPVRSAQRLLRRAGLRARIHGAVPAGSRNGDPKRWRRGERDTGTLRPGTVYARVGSGFGMSARGGAVSTAAARWGHGDRQFPWPLR